MVDNVCSSGRERPCGGENAGAIIRHDAGSTKSVPPVRHDGTTAKTKKQNNERSGVQNRISVLNEYSYKNEYCTNKPTETKRN